MYEMSTVLDHKGRKIWIKKVNDKFYLINGCLLSCGKLETFAVDKLAKVYDGCYSPDMCTFKDEQTQYVAYISGSDGRYMLAPYYIGENVGLIDMNALDQARVEFTDWFHDFSDKSLLYKNDCRHMSDIEYYRMRKNM